MKSSEFTKLAKDHLYKFDRRLGYLEDRGMDIQQLKGNIKEELDYIRKIITVGESNKPVSTEMLKEFQNTTSKLDEHISNFENSVLTMAPKSNKE